MPQVICTRENAGEEINGVAFTAVEGGMLSAEIDAEAAAAFLAIPGYELYAAAPVVPPAPAPIPEPAAAEPEDPKAPLLARAAAVGLSVKGTWGLTRLQKEVEDAEAAAAGAQTNP